ncbi:hypothetical protein LJR153_002004 [Paenibacillus sp. LjRoot153]|uniref:hypothetical protein n=1 Tax=Paenibacillus sp. LjRoot153 TaxID=3342270 RepID=UPI003ECC1FDA
MDVFNIKSSKDLIEEYFKDKPLKDGIIELEKSVKKRDIMRGTMYWEAENGYCIELAKYLIRKGANSIDMYEIVGNKNMLRKR